MRCPILMHSAAISSAIARSGGDVLQAEEHAAESHNYGNCITIDCAFWVPAVSGDGDCSFRKSVDKQSSIIKVLDYINNAVRDIVTVLRGRL